MKIQRVKKMAQDGFTLIELIVVIVILGILAAVALPKLTGTSAAAYESVQDATLGALKSAWSVAYAELKTTPTPAQVAGKMADPVCAAAGNVITCPTVKLNDGSSSAEFTAAIGTGTTVQAPSDITITKRAPAAP
jgi:prepilin-type N-terminal cleavage/methylation domain-containing protein